MRVGSRKPYAALAAGLLALLLISSPAAAQIFDVVPVPNQDLIFTGDPGEQADKEPPADQAADDGEFPAPAVPGDNLNPQIKQQLELLVRQQAADQWSFLMVHLDALDRACELSEAQQEKLRIAAKGAVDRSISEWLEAVSQNDAVAQNAIQQAAVGQRADLQGRLVAQQIQLGGVQRMVINGRVVTTTPPSGGNDPSGIAKHQLWTSTMDDVLSDEQKHAWREFEAQQDKRRRQLEVDQLVLELDRQLLLSPDQREKLRSWIDQVFGERLANVAAGGGRAANLSNYAALMYRTLLASDLKDLLTEAQLMRWQRLAGGNDGQANQQQQRQPNILPALIENIGGGLFNIAPRPEVPPPVFIDPFDPFE
ncbi:MAG: hypothetical protein WDZ59_08740 [Pirellulales bacterium]